MTDLTFDDERNTVRLSTESLEDSHCQQTIARIAEWAGSRDSVSIDLSKVEYLDWVNFESLLEIVRQSPAQVRFISVKYPIRTLFKIHRLEILLE